MSEGRDYIPSSVGAVMAVNDELRDRNAALEAGLRELERAGIRLRDVYAHNHQAREAAYDGLCTTLDSTRALLAREPAEGQGAGIGGREE